MERVYIAQEDMKDRYKPLSDRAPHIQSYLKSLKYTSDTTVAYELRTGPTAVFSFTDQPITREKRQRITEYIQGEFCDPQARKKYGNPKNLPHEEVTDRLPSREAVEQRLSRLTIGNLDAHDNLEQIGPYELRQFACPHCRNSWWRTVPKRKPVSRCRGSACHAQRYDALPMDQEFGIGKYYCSNCDRHFFAHCEATQVLQCRKCRQPCRNPIIHPRWRKKTRRDRSQSPRDFPRGGQRPPPAYPERGRQEEPAAPDEHIAAPNEHIAAPNEHIAAPDEPIVEEEQRQREPAFNPSTRHRSTGSTISTCITQGNEQPSEHELDYDDEISDATSYPRRFECSRCSNRYTVKCRMIDTARCQRCGQDNLPVGPSSSDHIQQTSTRRHNCSRCRGNGTCPNMR